VCEGEGVWEAGGDGGVVLGVGVVLGGGVPGGGVDGEEDDWEGVGVGVGAMTTGLSVWLAPRTLVAPGSAALTVKVMACPAAAAAGICSSACSGVPGGPGGRSQAEGLG